MKYKLDLQYKGIAVDVQLPKEEKMKVNVDGDVDVHVEVEMTWLDTVLGYFTFGRMFKIMVK